VWHVKEPSLLKAVSAKHNSKICSPVTGNGDSRQIAEKLLVRLKRKQINKQNFLIATTPILFKFDMMYLWDKGGIICEFHVSYPLGLMGQGEKCQN
jgi:hypothetical protein